MHLIKVVFPAPLSPTIAVTSHGRAEIVAPFNAFTFPNDFLTALHSIASEVVLIEHSLLMMQRELPRYQPKYIDNKRRRQ